MQNLNKMSIFTHDGDDMGTTGTTWGQHGVETMETTETTAMETTWGPSGAYGDTLTIENFLMHP